MAKDGVHGRENFIRGSRVLRTGLARPTLPIHPTRSLPPPFPPFAVCRHNQMLLTRKQEPVAPASPVASPPLSTRTKEAHPTHDLAAPHEPVCILCLDGVVPSTGALPVDYAPIFPCGCRRVFAHPACWNQWVTRHASCPICRQGDEELAVEQPSVDVRLRVVSTHTDDDQEELVSRRRGDLCCGSTRLGSCGLACWRPCETYATTSYPSMVVATSCVAAWYCFLLALAFGALGLMVYLALVK